MIYSWWSEHVGWSIQIFGNSTLSCLGFQWIDQKKLQCFMAETHEEILAFCPFNHFKKVTWWAKWKHWHMNWYTNPPLKDSCPSIKPPVLEDFRLPCFITELHLIEFKTCFWGGFPHSVQGNFCHQPDQCVDFRVLLYCILPWMSFNML